MEFSLKRNIVRLKRGRLHITGPAYYSVIANYIHAGILVPSEWFLHPYESLKLLHITIQLPTRDHKARGDFLWTEHRFTVQELHTFSLCSWDTDLQAVCEKYFCFVGNILWDKSVTKLCPGKGRDVKTQA